MSVVLLPRLDPLTVDELLDHCGAKGHPGPMIESTHALPERAWFASSGGTRAALDQLVRLRESMIAIGAASGFPDPGADARSKAKFDEEASAFLASEPMLQSGEALRDDAWAFIASVMLPDLVYWRFGSARARFQGGVRNALQRLWLRGRAFDRGEAAEDRWGLLRDLSEDAFVQITERPSLGANAVLARALAEGWVKCAAEVGRTRMEPVMRRVALRARLLNEVRLLAALKWEGLTALIEEEFGRASAAGSSPALSGVETDLSSHLQGEARLRE